MGFGDQRKFLSSQPRVLAQSHLISFYLITIPVLTQDPLWLTLYNTYGAAGGSPDRIGGAWQLRRISSVVVNGDAQNVETLYQRDTHKGIILSAPLQLTLKEGNGNTITVGGLFNGFDYKGADLDKIVVYPPEG
jgi:hypothetical protein